MLLLNLSFGTFEDKVLECAHDVFDYIFLVAFFDFWLEFFQFLDIFFGFFNFPLMLEGCGRLKTLFWTFPFLLFLTMFIVDE